MNLRELDLAKLNSLTKYPSIPTYHELDPRNGNLLENALTFPSDMTILMITEKVDGANARVIVLPNGEWVIGSREELLTARGDLIPNSKLGIVDTLRPLVDNLTRPQSGEIWTYYLETYGGGIGQRARDYTTSKTTTSCRLFDIGVTGDLNDPYDITDKFSWSREKIASWREHGGQRFMHTYRTLTMAVNSSLRYVPFLGNLPAFKLPTSIEDTLEFLTEYAATTRVALDSSAKLGCEGVVLRTVDRSMIAKARFEDYRRTVRRREQTK